MISKTSANCGINQLVVKTYQNLKHISLQYLNQSLKHMNKFKCDYQGYAISTSKINKNTR